VGLEWGPLSLLSTIKELLERKSSGSRSRKPRLRLLGICCTDYATPLYPQNLALTSATSRSCSVGVVHSRTKSTEFSVLLPFPNILTVTHFKIICLLFLCADFDLHFDGETATYTYLSYVYFYTNLLTSISYSFCVFYIVSILSPSRFTSSA
jgi:hypothetical protein